MRLLILLFFGLLATSSYGYQSEEKLQGLLFNGGSAHALDLDNLGLEELLGMTT